MKTVNAEKNKCCGCGLCANICPVHAIEMKEDELGYVYPYINEKICINCGKCVAQCNLNDFQSGRLPLASFAAVRTDKERLMQSSSGGAFAAVAEKFLAQGGYVCGASMDDEFNVKHVIINDVKDLELILGSKYVQSDITCVYDQLKALIDNHKVLFCGTPCQVDAIKRYLDYSNNLYTIEIICHGVPNIEMFKSYIEYIGKGDAQKYVFRDKQQGWSFNARLTMKDGKKKKINHRLSSYFCFFGKGVLYRESCLSCPYACSERKADLTIGDFWGVVRRCPSVASKLDIDKGVSCLLVNNEVGNYMIQDVELALFPVRYEDIKQGNGPLNEPSSYGSDREYVLTIWKNNRDWGELEIYWKKHYYKLHYLFWSILPKQIKQWVRILLRKR